jgi:cytochrome b561
MMLTTSPAYVLAAVVVVHSIGALRHHIFKSNDVLSA